MATQSLDIREYCIYTNKGLQSNTPFSIFLINRVQKIFCHYIIFLVNFPKIQVSLCFWNHWMLEPKGNLKSIQFSFYFLKRKLRHGAIESFAQDHMYWSLLSPVLNCTLLLHARSQLFHSYLRFITYRFHSWEIP